MDAQVYASLRCRHMSDGTFSPVRLKYDRICYMYKNRRAGRVCVCENLNIISNAAISMHINICLSK